MQLWGARERLTGGGGWDRGPLSLERVSQTRAEEREGRPLPRQSVKELGMGTPQLI